MWKSPPSECRIFPLLPRAFVPGPHTLPPLKKAGPAGAQGGRLSRARLRGLPLPPHFFRRRPQPSKQLPVQLPGRPHHHVVGPPAGAGFHPPGNPGVVQGLSQAEGPRQGKAGPAGAQGGCLSRARLRGLPLPPHFFRRRPQPSKQLPVQLLGRPHHHVVGPPARAGLHPPGDPGVVQGVAQAEGHR